MAAQPLTIIVYQYSFICQYLTSTRPASDLTVKRRTNVVLDQDLIEAGLEASGLKSRRALIDYALRQLLQRESQKKILELKGEVSWEGDLPSDEPEHLSLCSKYPSLSPLTGDHHKELN
jgi:Arc/MetJ family transcription regulator